MKYVYLLLFLLPAVSIAQPYTHQDTLRGSNGRGRSWWDVQKYHLIVEFDTPTNSIRGANFLSLTVKSNPIDSMQIDLQDEMILDSVRSKGVHLDFIREGHVYWIKSHFSNWKVGTKQNLVLNYHGIPKPAKHAPWDGGLISAKDSLGNKWLSIACQGLGASSWWPCKDYQGDEPDSGMSLYIDYPGMSIISNGKKGVSLGGIAQISGFSFIEDGKISKPLTIFKTRSSVSDWQVKNPINTYSTTFYIGDYAHWQDTFQGEKGTLNLDFYPLKYNEVKARKQWAVVKDMLRCYEYWLGPYPFYEDGYKLVEAPYLGMEHQSAIAYGNGYQMGYRGHALGGSVGMLFDYIIIHESGHEWFGNSITAQDIADNWLHEGFTTYTETLFAQWISNREEAFQYVAGEWNHIANDYPVIGDYGVNDDKGSDKYYKGAAVVHMIRMMLNDDEKFRQLLRGLNKDFYHKITTSAEVEAYISRFVGKDLSPFFDQFLRTKNQPVLEWFVRHKKLHYRWQNATPNFSAPFVLKNRDQQEVISGSDPAGLAKRKFRKRKVMMEACGWYEIREQEF